jgi:hypothetical protein
LLSDDEFYRLFDTFDHEAFHLEMRDSYGLDTESGPFGAFVRGEPDDLAWHEPWLSLVRRVAASGRRITRARIVTEPHVDYTRWGLTVAPHNIAAGEDIRWVPRHALPDGLRLPPHDFWLFDAERVVWTQFDDEGRFIGSMPEDDPVLIDQCRAAYRAVWSIAVTHDEYV